MPKHRRGFLLLAPSVGIGLALVFCGVFSGIWNLAAADDREDAMAAVEAYHRALAAQDSVEAVGLLADDVIVLESGHAETLGEYLGHHLGADMQFAAQVKSKRSVLQVVVNDDVAWVASSNKMNGEFRGNEIRAAGVELMVLSKVGGSWKIRAIHWSSRSTKGLD